MSLDYGGMYDSKGGKVCCFTATIIFKLDGVEVGVVRKYFDVFVETPTGTSVKTGEVARLALLMLCDPANEDTKLERTRYQERSLLDNITWPRVAESPTFS